MNVSIDLETSGYSPEENAIIEIGAIFFNDEGIPVCEYSTLIRPYNFIDKDLIYLDEAMAVSGIEINEISRCGTNIQDALRYLCELIIAFDVDTIIGHNIRKFDYPFLVKNIHAFADRYDSVLSGLSISDTWEIAKDLNYPKRSLKSICEMDHIPYFGTHRAIDDARSTMDWYLMNNELSETF